MDPSNAGPDGNAREGRDPDGLDDILGHFPHNGADDGSGADTDGAAAPRHPDPFAPPEIPILVHCIHCGEEFDSWRIQFCPRPGAPGRDADNNEGDWACPVPGCDGVGFCFDIWPVDPNWRDANGDRVCHFSDDDDEEEDEEDGGQFATKEWSPDDEEDDDEDTCSLDRFEADDPDDDDAEYDPAEPRYASSWRPRPPDDFDQAAFDASWETMTGDTHEPPIAPDGGADDREEFRDEDIPF